jgi:hypothetical protein
VRLPERAPTALGLKVIEMVQAAEAASFTGLTGQLLVATKSDKFDVMLVIVIAEV